MKYSPEERRKILKRNYLSERQLEFTKLEDLSIQLKTQIQTFRGENCGDVLHLLIERKKDAIERCFFAQQSCLIVVSAANILCTKIEKKNVKQVIDVIEEWKNIFAGKNFSRKSHSVDISEMEVFVNIKDNNPHRLQCIELVLKAFRTALSKTT